MILLNQKHSRAHFYHCLFSLAAGCNPICATHTTHRHFLQGGEARAALWLQAKASHVAGTGFRAHGFQQLRHVGSVTAAQALVEAHLN